MCEVEFWEVLFLRKVLRVFKVVSSVHLLTAE